MHIVAGDIGGTSARLALFDTTGATPRLLARATYPSRGHPGIEPILSDFLAARAVRPAAVALGVAGPVRDGVCRTTNLPWVLSAHSIAASTGVARAWLLNDLDPRHSCTNSLAALQPQTAAVPRETFLRARSSIPRPGNPGLAPQDAGPG